MSSAVFSLLLISGLIYLGGEPRTSSEFAFLIGDYLSVLTSTLPGYARIVHFVISST